jgi:hypothetical protein
MRQWKEVALKTAKSRYNHLKRAGHIQAQKNHMKLEFAFFADAADVRPDGTMYLLGGGIDHVKSQSFPAVHQGGMVLVARLRAEPNELGDHQVSAKVFRPRGEPWTPEIALNFNVPPNKLHPERGNCATVCLRYLNFVFPESGEYTFRLFIDGNEVGHVNFDAKVES